MKTKEFEYVIRIGDELSDHVHPFGYKVVDVVKDSIFLISPMGLHVVDWNTFWSWGIVLFKDDEQQNVSICEDVKTILKENGK